MRWRWCCALIAGLAAALVLRIDAWRRVFYERLIGDCWAEDTTPLPLASSEANLATVHVAYSGDRTVFPGLLVSMLSLARKLEAPADCLVHLIVARADLAAAHRLADCFRRELADLAARPSVQIHELLPGTFDLTADSQRVRNDLSKPQVFARNYLHEYLPSAPRALWLDCDTIIRSDVTPLYRWPLVHAVAAAPDQRHRRAAGGWRGELADRARNVQEELRKDFGLAASFNSGVLVIDLERWRSAELSLALERRSAPGHVLGPSTKRNWTLTQQLGMNLELGGGVDRLDFRWNVLGLGSAALGIPRRCVREARILHWNGARKPWVQDGSRWPSDELFAEHAPRQPCEGLT